MACPGNLFGTFHVSGRLRGVVWQFSCCQGQLREIVWQFFMLPVRLKQGSSFRNFTFSESISSLNSRAESDGFRLSYQE